MSASQVCFSKGQIKACEVIDTRSYVDLDPQVINFEEAGMIKQAFERLKAAGTITAEKSEYSQWTVGFGSLSRSLEQILAQANFTPRGLYTISTAQNKTELISNIERFWRGHIETAMHYGLANMESDIKQKIEAAYSKQGQFDVSTFLWDFFQAAVKALKEFDWEDNILVDGDSEAEADNFELGDVNRALKGVGKDIVVAAVYVRGTRDKLNEVLSDPKHFTSYDSYLGTGINEARQCAPSIITIRFGGGLAGDNAVRVVNQNQNKLAAKGIQYWRLARPEPTACPKIHDIKTNIGIQSVFPYKDGFVVLYLLMATPSTQIGASSAMENTMDSIERLAEGG